MATGSVAIVWACVQGAATELVDIAAGADFTGSCPSGYGIAKVSAYLLDPSSQEQIEGLVSASSVFSLTPEQGGQIGVAILGIWAIAWGIKMLARFLNNLGEREEDETV